MHDQGLDLSKEFVWRGCIELLCILQSRVPAFFCKVWIARLLPKLCSCSCKKLADKGLLILLWLAFRRVIKSSASCCAAGINANRLQARCLSWQSRWLSVICFEARQQFHKSNPAWWSPQLSSGWTSKFSSKIWWWTNFHLEEASACFGNKFSNFCRR